MITINDKQIKKLEVALDVLVKNGYENAVRETLNITVANARKSAIKMIKEKMIIKGGGSNNPAIRGVQFEQIPKNTPVRKQVAIIGHVAPFWPLQEFGGVVQGKSGKSLVLPTGASANQEGTAKRTRPVTKRNRLSNIKLRKGGTKAANRKQRNAIAIALARKKGASKEVFLDLGRGKSGIFKVTKTKIIMLHDMSRKSARVPPTPVIGPAAEKQAKFIPEFYEQRLRRELNKARRR